MSAYADNSGRSLSYTHNFSASYVWAQPYLQTFFELEDGAGADTYVAQYVQAGTPHTGNWPLVSGPNFTSITYKLEGQNCIMRAVWVTEFFD